jgi:hypothetical protein
MSREAGQEFGVVFLVKISEVYVFLDERAKKRGDTVSGWKR